MRRALVTGGSRGIGAAVVTKFRNEGIEVFAPTRDDLDLGDTRSTDTFLKKGPLGFDIVVHNAGINPLGASWDFQDQDLEKTLATNVIAPMRLTRGLLPHMMEKKWGRIVNIGSIWSQVTKPRRTVYTTSKAALHGYTRSLSVELAPYGILVNTLSPGFVDTELTRANNSPSEIETLCSRIPLGRMATTVEIAEAVFFLCSEKNGFLTGQNILIDGGFSIQ